METEIQGVRIVTLNPKYTLSRHRDGGDGDGNDFTSQICIRADAIGEINNGRRGSLWYVLTLTDSDPNPSPQPHKKRKRKIVYPYSLSSRIHTLPVKRISIESGCISVGTKVYAVGARRLRGGGFRYSHIARVIDMSCPGAKWGKIRPQMIGRRLSPQVLLFNNKLYVFGGNMGDGVTPWAEVYDHSCKMWKAIPRTPDYLCNGQMFAYPMPRCSNKILVGDFTKLYAYNVDTDSWECIRKQYSVKSPSVRPNIRVTPVIVDDSLYWIGLEHVYAYSLSTNVLKEGPADPRIVNLLMEGFSDLGYRPLFFHLRDTTFCFIFLRRNYLPDNTKLCSFRCIKFSVINENDCLKVTTIAATKYMVDHYDLHDIEGILLDKVITYGSDSNEEERPVGSR